MILIIVAAIILNVLGQKRPDFFEKADYEYVDYQQRNPYQRDQGQHKRDHDQDKPKKLPKNKRPLIDPNSLYEELEYKLEKYDKYDEYKTFTDEMKRKTRMNPKRTAADEFQEVYQWIKNLGNEPPPENEMQPQVQPPMNVKPPFPGPSPGMSQYWAEPEQKKPKFPMPDGNTPQHISGKEVMKLALRNLESIDAIDKKSPMEKFPEVMKNLPKDLPTDLLKYIPKSPNTQNTTRAPIILPKVDDYFSPIRWVSLLSNDTRDGLAKVTDPRTGRNQQFIINETVYVPVIDYDIGRLGLTSTTQRPVLTTDKRILQTVQRSLDFKKVDEQDWLAFETVLGGRNESNRCDGEHCQSRCKNLACDSVCTGDTCASGCIGGFCNAFCKGPGCFAMCIGESCTAKCDGMACDTRCRGTGCEAGCRSFSCTYSINGKSARGGGSWSDHYPQYEDNNIKNERYE